MCWYVQKKTLHDQYVTHRGTHGGTFLDEGGIDEDLENDLNPYLQDDNNT